MSRTEKSREKLFRKPPPKDLRWEEFVHVLGSYGFKLNEESGDSHHFFVLERNGVHYRINAARPHPGSIVKVYKIKEVTQKLADWGFI